jgi:hypothetical protein
MSIGGPGVLLLGLFSFLSFLAALAMAERVRWPRGRWLVRLRPTGALSAVVTVIGGLLGLYVAGYSGVLLAVTNRPIWADTSLLGLNFLVSAASTSAALLILLGSRRSVPSGGVHALERFDAGMLVLELVAIAALLASLGPILWVWLSVWGALLVVGVVGLGIFPRAPLATAPARDRHRPRLDDGRRPGPLRRPPVPRRDRALVGAGGAGVIRRRIAPRLAVTVLVTLARRADRLRQPRGDPPARWRRRRRRQRRRRGEDARGSAPVLEDAAHAGHHGSVARTRAPGGAAQPVTLVSPGAAGLACEHPEGRPWLARLERVDRAALDPAWAAAVPEREAAPGPGRPPLLDGAVFEPDPAHVARWLVEPGRTAAPAGPAAEGLPRAARAVDALALCEASLGFEEARVDAIGRGAFESWLLERVLAADAAVGTGPVRAMAMDVL